MGDKEVLKLSEAGDFKKERRKLYKLPVSQLVVEIRKLRLTDFTDVGELPPLPHSRTMTDDEKALYESEVKKNLVKDTTRSIKILQEVVCKGVINPHIAVGDVANCKEDEVHISDIEDADLVSLVNEILAFSNLGKEAGEKLRPFSGQRGPEDSGLPGEKVPDASSSDTGA